MERTPRGQRNTVTPESRSTPQSQPHMPGAITKATDAGRMHRWNRRERELAAKRLMSMAFIEIRALAYTTREGREDPSEALEQIRLLADACHNLPGVIGRRPPAPGDIDPLIGPWRDPREHDWMARVLKSTDLDTAWLDAEPRWPPVLPLLNVLDQFVMASASPGTSASTGLSTPPCSGHW